MSRSRPPPRKDSCESHGMLHRIAPNTLRLEFALGSDVTGLTAVLEHQVPTAAVPGIDDCTSFLEDSNEVVQGPL